MRLQLAALKDVTISSSDGKLVLTADKEVWIGAGGSYIRITGERIENVTPGDIFEKCASWDKHPPAAMTLPPQQLPRTACKSCLIDAMRSGQFGIYIK